MQSVLMTMNYLRHEKFKWFGACFSSIKNALNESLSSNLKGLHCMETASAKCSNDNELSQA